MEYHILRAAHIFGGIIWAGFAGFVGLYLMPALAEAGPGGGSVMGSMVRRKLPLVVNVFALICLLSGLRLFMLRAGEAAWITTPQGLLLTLGAVFGIAGFTLGFTVQRPTAAKLGALSAAIQAAGGPPSAEQQSEMKALGARMGKAGKVNAHLLLSAAACMVLSRVLQG